MMKASNNRSRARAHVKHVHDFQTMMKASSLPPHSIPCIDTNKISKDLRNDDHLMNELRLSQSNRKNKKDGVAAVEKG